jgi:hypothetical protein
VSEQVQESPAARSPLARLMGVIVSPVETFQEIERRPGWLFPMVAYLLLFGVCFGVYGMKADWIAIVGSQVESFFGFLPDDALDEAISEATKALQNQTQAERTVSQLVNAVPYFVPIYHFWAVLYATLFVLMGSLQSLKLGRAWLWFFLCVALIIPYGLIAFLANTVFGDSQQAALIMTGLGAVVFVGAYLWFLNRQTVKDDAFNRVMSVASYSMVVMMIWALAVLAVSVVSEEPIETPVNKLVKANLGAILKPGAGALRALLDWIDVFVIWSVVSLTIGFRAVTKLSTGLTAAVAILPYAFMAAVHITWVAVFG